MILNKLLFLKTIILLTSVKHIFGTIWKSLCGICMWSLQSHIEGIDYIN